MYLSKNLQAPLLAAMLVSSSTTTLLGGDLTSGHVDEDGGLSTGPGLVSDRPNKLVIRSGRVSQEVSSSDSLLPADVPSDTLNRELRVMLSSPGVLKNMHTMAARHGMHLAELERTPGPGEIVVYVVTFMGGVVPQNTGSFETHVGEEGPPPATLSVTFVGPIKLDEKPEGPPQLE